MEDSHFCAKDQSSSRRTYDDTSMDCQAPVLQNVESLIGHLFEAYLSKGQSILSGRPVNASHIDTFTREFLNPYLETMRREQDAAAASKAIRRHNLFWRRRCERYTSRQRVWPGLRADSSCLHRISRKISILGHQHSEVSDMSTSVESCADVTVAKFDKTGSSIITGAAEGIIKVWGARSGNHVYSLRRHNHDITEVDICPDNEYLASCSSSGVLRIWRVGQYSWEPTASISQNFSISLARFLPKIEGETFKLMCCACDDGQVRLYDTFDLARSNGGRYCGPPLCSIAVVDEILPIGTYCWIAALDVSPISIYLPAISVDVATLIAVGINYQEVSGPGVRSRRWAKLVAVPRLQSRVTASAIQLLHGPPVSRLPQEPSKPAHESSVRMTVARPVVLEVLNGFPVFTSDEEETEQWRSAKRRKLSDARVLPQRRDRKIEESVYVPPSNLESLVLNDLTGGHTEAPDVCFANTHLSLVTASDDGCISLWKFGSTMTQGQQNRFSRLTTWLRERFDSGRYDKQSKVPAAVLAQKRQEKALAAPCPSPTANPVECVDVEALAASRRSVYCIDALCWSADDNFLLVADTSLAMSQKNRKKEKASTRETCVSVFNPVSGKRERELFTNREFKTHISFLRSNPVHTSVFLIGSFGGQIAVIDVGAPGEILKLVTFNKVVWLDGSWHPDGVSFVASQKFGCFSIFSVSDDDSNSLPLRQVLDQYSACLPEQLRLSDFADIRDDPRDAHRQYDYNTGLAPHTTQEGCLVDHRRVPYGAETMLPNVGPTGFGSTELSHVPVPDRSQCTATEQQLAEFSRIIERNYTDRVRLDAQGNVEASIPSRSNPNALGAEGTSDSPSLHFRICEAEVKTKSARLHFIERLSSLAGGNISNMPLDTLRRQFHLFCSDEKFTVPSSITSRQSVASLSPPRRQVEAQVRPSSRRNVFASGVPRRREGGVSVAIGRRRLVTLGLSTAIPSSEETDESDEDYTSSSQTSLGDRSRASSLATEESEHEQESVRVVQRPPELMPTRQRRRALASSDETNFARQRQRRRLSTDSDRPTRHHSQERLRSLRSHVQPQPLPAQPPPTAAKVIEHVAKFTVVSEVDDTVRGSPRDLLRHLSPIQRAVQKARRKLFNVPTSNPRQTVESLLSTFAFQKKVACEVCDGAHLCELCGVEGSPTFGTVNSMLTHDILGVSCEDLSVTRLVEAVSLVATSEDGDGPLVPLVNSNITIWLHTRCWASAVRNLVKRRGVLLSQEEVEHLGPHVANEVEGPTTSVVHHVIPLIRHKSKAPNFNPTVFALIQRLSKECSKCSRNGAFLMCSGCDTPYHLPCATASWNDHAELRSEGDNLGRAIDRDTFFCPSCYQQSGPRRIRRGKEITFTTFNDILQGVSSEGCSTDRMWLMRRQRRSGDVVPQLGDVLRYFPHVHFDSLKFVEKLEAPCVWIDMPELSYLVRLVNLKYELQVNDRPNKNAAVVAVLTFCILTDGPLAGILIKVWYQDGVSGTTFLFHESDVQAGIQRFASSRQSSLIGRRVQIVVDDDLSFARVTSAKLGATNSRIISPHAGWEAVEVTWEGSSHPENCQTASVHVWEVEFVDDDAPRDMNGLRLLCAVNETMPVETLCRLIRALEIVCCRPAALPSVRRGLRSTSQTARGKSYCEGCGNDCRTLRAILKSGRYYEIFAVEIPSPFSKKEDEADWVKEYWNRTPVPISLPVILSRLHNRYYRSLTATMHDVELLRSNAESFHSPNSNTAQLGRRLESEVRRLVEMDNRAFESDQWQWHTQCRVPILTHFGLESVSNIIIPRQHNQTARPSRKQRYSD